MIPMTLAEVAAVIGAHAPEPSAASVIVTSVEFDSRRVAPGALFVALPGEHADGHDFAGAAASHGAVAVLGTRPVAELPTLIVPSREGAVSASGVMPGSTDVAATRARDADAVLHALSALAHHVVTGLIDGGLTVVGVTGSSGKTSTKDLIAAVLSRAGAVVAPPESFNNELGHPYTVLRADASTDFLVLELSARGIGHIAALTAIARPRIGVVLNVGSAHLGEFGSRDAIAQAKGELVEALPTGADRGIAILNADDPRVAAMAPRTRATIVTTGVEKPADVRAAHLALDAAARAAFELITPEGTAPVRLAVVGGHQVANALAAAAVGRAVGLDVVTVAAALSAAGPASKWRMAVSVVAGVTIVNDAYNANPESMRAALEALRQMATGGSRWAVIGEMAELGDDGPAAHLALGRDAYRSGARVVAVGQAARPVFDGAISAANAVGDTGPGDIVLSVRSEADAAARMRPLWYPDIPAAVAGLLPLIRGGDVVLIKASRAVGLERCAARLAEALPSVLARPASGAPDGEERP